MRRISTLFCLAVLALLLAQVAGATERPSIRVHVEATNKAQLKALMNSDLDFLQDYFRGLGVDALVTFETRRV